MAGLVASSALAEGAFVGVEGGVAHQFIENSGATNGVIGIKGGYDFGEFRAYGEFNHNLKAKLKDSELKNSSNEFLAGADYFFYDARNIKAFGGAYLGLENRKFSFDDASKTYNAFMLGAKIGGIYEIDAHSGIEFGVKFDKPFHSGELEDFKVTKLSGFAGYTYKF